ncbi:protein PFC0760c-like [Belonocnema kinseyi]|uniref:protein PFC0760c-like n=1 Tax=Belonocnema kinseyi TaxID=2817044 RepID=UPI00143DA139|nr:protein PFC0760c-like [Belonocnema kinseyi]
MYTLFSVIVLSILGTSWASPTRIEKMTVSKMRMADLENSASGYSYNQQHGLPASYIQYTNHGSNLYYDAPKPLQYDSTHQVPLQAHFSPPLHSFHAPRVVYSDLGTGLPYAPREPHLQPVDVPEYLLVKPQAKAVAPYYTDKKVGENNNFEVYENYNNNNSEEDLGDDNDDDDDLDDNDNDEGEELHQDHKDHVIEEPHGGVNAYGQSGALIRDYIPVSLGHYGDSHEEYERENGKDYKAEKHNEYGEEGERGYKGYRQFDHGEKGGRSTDYQTGHFDEEGGHENAHSQTDAHYGQHDEGEKGEKGSSYGQASYHKKGHKTTGFHNVYRKDEYKKDTDFYDEDHNSGQFDKHATGDEHHDAAHGTYEKGDHHESGYGHSDRVKAGLIDRGHNYRDHQGHKAEQGGDSYHDVHSDYGNRGGASFTKEHGYGHGHGYV